MKKIYLLSLFIFTLLSSNAQLNVNSSNYVGIGTTNPLAPLHVNGTTYISGALGIGATSLSALLHVNGSAFIPAGSSYWINSTSDSGDKLRMHFNSSYGAFIDYSPTLYFRKTSNQSAIYVLTLSPGGYVGINNSSPSCALDVTGTIKMNGAVVLTSDERLKNNIKDMSGSLSSLTQLHGVTYNLKPFNTTISKNISAKSTQNDTIQNSTVELHGMDSICYSRKHIGFLAQEIQAVFPDLVYTDKNGFLSVDYISLIPVLVESIKEQQSTINDLKAIVNDLKNKLNSKQ